MPEKRVNDIEGWAGYRHRFFGVPQKKYMKLSGATLTVHPTSTGIIESYITVVGSTVTISILGRVLTVQVQSGYKYYLHFQNRFQCQEWAAFIKNASTRRFSLYYEIGEQIGEGSFATVHKGTRKTDGAVVAVKKVIKQQFDMVTYRELQREIYAMQNIQHAGVVKTYDVFSTPTEVYFVLEFMQGGSLKDLVRKAGGKISEAASLAITKQVLQALAYLHGNGYAHRDIKLENVLCETEDLGSTRVCLADFGYTNFFEDLGDDCMRSLIGTPVYVAPEIFHEKPYSEAVDMYAMGVMIYRMLCGEYPYDGGEDNDKTKDLTIQGKLDFRQSAWKEISAEAKSLVRGLLQPTPQKRLIAQGALQHSWFTNRRLDAVTNGSEGLSLPGNANSQTTGIGLGGESTTIISRVAPVNSSNQNPNDPHSPTVQDLIARFRITNDSSTAEQNSDVQARIHVGMQSESPSKTAKGDHETRDNDADDDEIRHSHPVTPDRVDDVEESDDSFQSPRRYAPEELWRKLKLYILAAVFSSKLLLVSQLRRPKRRRINNTISERPKIPDRRREESNEMNAGRNGRRSSQSINFRAFSFSGRMNGNGRAFSPVARLTSRLKRTLSLGRDRR